MKNVIAIISFAAVVLGTAVADEPKRSERKEQPHNYILERQEAYQVQGVPTSRLIIGKREVDIYPNGLMFEKNNVVGIKDR